MAKKIKNYLLIFIIWFLINLLFKPSVSLAAPTGITIQPVKFLFDLSLGEIKEEKISVVNPNNFELALRPEIEDFVPSAGTAGIDFIPKAPGIMSLVDWINISKDLIVLKPNEQREIIFKITVPQNAEPGSHFAAIFFKTQPLPGQEGSSLMISTRVGSLILVTIPGEVSKSGELITFKGPKFVSRGPVKFDINFRNTGSVHYETEGIITIKNIFGKKSAEIATDKQWILPTGQKNLKAIWNVNYIFGPFEAQLEIKDGAGKSYYASLKFFAFPWKEFLLTLAGLIILFFILRFLKKTFKITITKRSNSDSDQSSNL